MFNPTEVDESRITYTDWQLVRAYYPILLELAIESATAVKEITITYGELVATAKERNPDVPEVQRAIPLTSGRSLGIMRQYTNDQHPDLACLVVRKDKSECGIGYTAFFKASERRQEVLGYKDWASELASYDGFLEHEPPKPPHRARRPKIKTKAQAARKPIKHPKRPAHVKKPAKSTRKKKAILTKPRIDQAIWDYYDQNAASLPSDISLKREFIYDMVVKGTTVEDAYAAAIQSS